MIGCCSLNVVTAHSVDLFLLTGVAVCGGGGGMCCGRVFVVVWCVIWCVTCDMWCRRSGRALLPGGDGRGRVPQAGRGVRGDAAGRTDLRGGTLCQYHLHYHQYNHDYNHDYNDMTMSSLVWCGVVWCGVCTVYCGGCIIMHITHSKSI